MALLPDYPIFQMPAFPSTEYLIFKGKGSLDNGYLDNFDNKFLNKHTKNLLIYFSTYW
jgi:hypothetical protein